MLGEHSVFPTVAVKDLGAAKQFYENTLGLKMVDEGVEGVMYQVGSGKMLVYPSQYAGTNQATYAGWEVPDVAAMVKELQDKGVQFEKYDMPGTEKEADGVILVMQDERSAWFKDPDGNIFAISAPHAEKM
jgi:catechol 2,3-dioxygenase-like lactoylglutathione lyase family enzyme